MPFRLLCFSMPQLTSIEYDPGSMACSPCSKTLLRTPALNSLNISATESGEEEREAESDPPSSPASAAEVVEQKSSEAEDEE